VWDWRVQGRVQGYRGDHRALWRGSVGLIPLPCPAASGQHPIAWEEALCCVGSLASHVLVRMVDKAAKPGPTSQVQGGWEGTLTF
jgi:hypothetical protein